MAASVAVGQSPSSVFLQILHSSDNESSFQDPNTLEEKVIHYSALVNGLQQLAASEGIPSLHMTAGDHSIPGPFYRASSEVQAYGHNGLADIAIYNAFPNLANGFGNHEFDGGINDLAYMINAANYPMIAVNLDFSNVQLEPDTPAIEIGVDASPCTENAGKVVKSCYIMSAAEGNNLTVGIIGRAPFDFFEVIEDPETNHPGLDFVGGRDPDTNESLESALPMVLEQVDLLTAQGAAIIVLLDHAQDFTGDPLSLELLRGVDVIISAGSTGFMAGETNGPFNYLREDEIGVTAAYPFVGQDSEGKTVLVVNTDQLYSYIGHLIVEFDDAGDVIGYDDMRSGPIATTPEAVELLRVELGIDELTPQPEVSEVVDLLQASPSITSGFEVVGSTVFPLNGERANVRGRETNLGRVAADSTLWEAQMFATDNNLPPVDVALKNGGGIRDTIAGPSITRFTIEAALAFDNKLALIELTAGQLLATMENAVSRVPFTDGRFPQVAGMYLQFDTVMPGVEGAESMDTPVRVKNLNVTRADGTEDVLVMNSVAQGDLNRTFVMATNSFLLTGGDGYISLTVGTPLGETELGEQQILENYIVDALGGEVNMVDPPVDPRVEFACLNLVDALPMDQFEILHELVVAAGLEDAIDVPGPITLFAPTDAAFLALPDGTLDALKADPEALIGVLTYHVAGGLILSSDLEDGQAVTMLNQQTATVSISDTDEGVVMINDAATVTAFNMLACNGVYHVLDAVLLPQAETSPSPPTDGPPAAAPSPPTSMTPSSSEQVTGAPTPASAAPSASAGAGGHFLVAAVTGLFLPLFFV